MSLLSNQTVFLSYRGDNVKAELDHVSCPIIQNIGQNIIQMLHSQFFNNCKNSSDNNTIYEDDMFLPRLLRKYKTQYRSIVENNTDWLMGEACETSLEQYANLTSSFLNLATQMNDSRSSNALKARSIRSFLLDILRFTRVDFVVLMCSWYRYHMWWRPSSYLSSQPYYEMKVRDLIRKCNLTSFSGIELQRDDTVDFNKADNDSYVGEEEDNDDPDKDGYETTTNG